MIHALEMQHQFKDVNDQYVSNISWPLNKFSPNVLLYLLAQVDFDGTT